MQKFGDLIQTQRLIYGTKVLSMVNIKSPMNSIPICIRKFRVYFQRYVYKENAPMNKILNFESCTMYTLLNFQFKAMEKIEEVTCIKFEERRKNNHKELVL